MGERVSTLELFFDLVFVLIVTQLTGVLAHDPDLEHLARVTVVLAVVWWMYSGYAWLTNAVATDGTARRLVLLGGMGAFLVVALVVPHAFDEGGVELGAAYLAVVLVHVALYSRAAGITDPSSLWRLARWNVAAAVALIVGGTLAPGPQLAVWAAVALLQYGVVGYHTARTTGEGAGFAVRAPHFVERHGLVVIVAIGESVVALGLGLADRDLDGGITVAALLGLALSACLWWTYFGDGDDEAAADALGAAPPASRFRMALEAYGHAHLGLLLAIVAVAAGVEGAAHAPAAELDLRYALLLGSGAAGYLLADAALRHRLGLGPSWLRIGGAVPAVGSAAAGAAVAGYTQLGVLVAVFTALFMVERRTGRATLGPAG